MIIGTRGSRLALWQAKHVQSRLIDAGVKDCRLEILRTQGDRIQDVSFAKMEGKGFFTSELESALARGQIDLAVHSLKDLPTELPLGLTLGAVTSRADPRDVLVLWADQSDPGAPFDLKPGTVVGTSSNRRRVQLLATHPQLEVRPLRGNVPTRIQRLLEGRFGAIVLAAAGLDRLELQHGLSERGLLARRLEVLEMVPAPGQGALGLQCRVDDTVTREAVSALHDPETAEAVRLERELLQALGGGCQLPLGAYAHRIEETGGWELLGAWPTALPPELPLPDEDDAESGARPAAEISFRVVHCRVQGTDGLPAKTAASLQRKAERERDLSGSFVWLSGGDTARSELLATRLEARGARTWVRPLIRKIPLQCEAALLELQEKNLLQDLCFFSSRQAIRRFAETLEALGYDHLRSFEPVAAARLAVMGDSSARAAIAELGVDSVHEIASAGIGSSEFARRLLETFGSRAGSLLVLRAEDGRSELPDAFRDAGWQVTEILGYRSEPARPTAQEIAALPAETAVLLSSPSAADALMDSSRRPDLHLISIGPTTSAAIRAAGGRVAGEAPDPSFDGLEQALLWAPDL